MARFSAEHFESVTDFLDTRGIDYSPADLAMELGDLSLEAQVQLWDIVENGSYEDWVEYCEEHGIHYHG